jgi:hypothetical protein
MMNHPQKNRDDDNLGKLLAGVAFIVFLTTGVILGTDGIAALWAMISPF